jgi:hypothetical protein
MSQVTQEKPLSKLEILRKLFKEYNLLYDSNDPESKDNDLYKHKHYTIITRSGIEKIQKAAGIEITYNCVFASENAFYIHAKGKRGDDTVETFSSASPATSKSAYYPEMAEKRAMSRIVLKLAGLYEYGVFGEDESDDFKRTAKASSGGAVYKGQPKAA